MAKKSKRNSTEIILLATADIERLLTPALCLSALERAYADLHHAPEDQPKTVGFKTTHGKLHVKAGLLPRTQKYFAAKVNANFPENAARLGLPTIQGLIALFSCETGSPLAVLQSGELTGRRTAATAALAARFAASPNSRALTVIGAGVQARYQIDAFCDLFSLRTITVFDTDAARAAALAEWAGEKHGVGARRAPSLERAFEGCDIAVTLTPSRKAFVAADMIPRGAFVAAMGADNPDKQEIDPGVFAAARVIVDDLEQCAKEGDLAHAIRAGVASRETVSATLAELSAGMKPGRTRDDETVLFDSTGSGVQDAAAAAAVYEAALAACAGARASL